MGVENTYPDCDLNPQPSSSDQATFLADITLPDDGPPVSPGVSLVKTWRVRNSGTSTWDGYKLIFVSGDQMSAPSPVDIPYTSPGAEVDISIPIVAPQTSARGDWQIVNTSGTWVPNGQLWVILDVQGTEPVVTSDIDLDCVNNTCYATVAPGQTFRPTIRATVNNGQLLESRGDMLRLKDGDLYGAWPHVAVQGTVNTGQSYDFTFYADNPIQAPSQEGTYQNTWQVWRDGNWAGEEFILQFTVSQSGGSNRPPNRPDPASPNDWTVYYSGNTATLCAQANGDPDGDAITGYYFDVYESAQLWNSGWVASNCVTTGAFSPYGYQWRVKVRDSRGAESEWSDTWHFTLVDQNLTITGPTFEPLDGQSEVVRIRACTDGQGGVGITLRVSVNSANDGTDAGEWRVLKELGVPCFNEVDAPTWNTLEYEGGPHLVRVEAHGSNTGWDGATVAHGTFTVPSNHRPNSPVILPNLDERYFDSPTIHLDSVTSLRTTSQQIVASINSDYSSPLIDEPITYSATGYTYTLDAEYARIYWRITATGPYGSNTSSFETHIDMIPPDSQVSALPPVTTDTRFTVNWSGSDVRAGLRWYHIQVRDASRPDSVWEDWLVNTTKTAEIFQGQPGHTYAFRARAMDSIGNWEAWPAGDSGDTYTLIDPSAAPPTAWWDANYAHKRNLVILNNDSDTMPTGFPLHIHFDTTTTPSAAEIYNASLSATKGNDVRVVYDNQTELNRFVQRFTTAQIDLWFPLQAALGGGQTNTGSYQLYYGSAVAGTPPADINTVFLPHVDSNTMGMWHFQEGAGNTVTDSSDRGHHGYFYNAGWGDGYLGNTGIFNGTSAYVEIPHSDDFKPGAITLEAWIYLDRPLSYTARIFTKSRYEVRIHHDGNLQFVINAAGGDRTITGQAKLLANQWYHVAATYDGGTRMRLYVNGVLDKEENFGAPPENWNDYPLRIGREPYDFTSYFPGYIQHARISNVERTNFSYGRVTVSPSVAAGLQLDLEAAGAPDLAILDLNTYPNTNGGLLVLALVENQGDASTQNNFYTDLYIDHLPTGAGDYTGSLQFWVNSPVAAGAYITLTTVITDLSSLDGQMARALALPGSEVTATLYTQVDSAGVISETDNLNNISMGTDICFASSDAYENMTTDVNLLSNAGFEQGDSDPFDWETSAWQYDPSAFTWDTTYVHNGMQSVKIANTTPNDAMWLQTVAVQSHTNYRLSGWIKTEDVTHTTELNDAGANLSLSGTWERTNGVFGSQDWTYVSLDFNSGDSLSVTVAARLGFWSGTITGTAWFDDLHLEPLGETISGDDTVTNAHEITVGEVQVHNMDSLMDRDWLKFQAQGGVTYTLSTFDLGPAADTYLYLYDTDGTTLLAANDDYNGSLTSQIDWTAPTTGTYYLLVQHWNPNVGGCGTGYTVSIDIQSSIEIHHIYLPIVLRDYAGVTEPTQHPPYAPSNPSPVNATTNLELNTNLSWTGGDPDGDNVTYDVYFEANDESPDVLICADITTTTCDPGILNHETHYYWQVITTDSHNATTTGPVWNFFTESAPPIVGPLAYTNHTIDDDQSGNSNGNGDGVINPGETVELYVTLENLGTDTAMTVTAVLTTTDPYVPAFLVNDSSTYPDILGGDTGQNLDDWEFTVDPATPDGHVITFTLDSIAAANGGPWTDSFTVSVSQPPGVKLYVTGANGVSVIDTLSNTIVMTIPTGSSAQGITSKPGGNRAYTADGSANRVSVLDLVTNAVLTTIPVGEGPVIPAISSDGTRLYVTNGGSSSVSVIDTSTNTVTQTITDVFYPWGVAVNPDGSRIAVSRYWGDVVCIFDTSTYTKVTDIAVGANPQGVIYHPDGSRLYVANLAGSSISVIDTTTNAVIQTIPVGSQPGNNPTQFGFNADATRLYIANDVSCTVSEIDVTTGSVLRSFDVGSSPRDVEVVNQYLYVTNWGSNSVSVVDLNTGTVIKTITGFSSPHSITR